MYNGLHVKCPLFLSTFSENFIFSADFRKYSDVKFLENPPSWIRVISCGRVDKQTDRQTAMKKPRVTFGSFGNMPNIVDYISEGVLQKETGA